MDLFDIKYALEHITIIIDTREQDTMMSRRRFKDICKTERHKLNVGDYSCKCVLPDDKEINFSDKFVIERKMNIDELCSCFARGRDRFQREFERAKINGTKIYLLVENGDWESCFDGKYRSRFNSDALIASIISWAIRYGVQIIFCKPSTTGKLIYKLMRYEVKEYLENIESENNEAG